MKYIPSIVLLFCILSCGFQEKPKEKKYLDHVGDLEYNPTLDSKDFKPCHEDLISQYYAFREHIQYEGEKRGLVKQIEAKYDNSLSKDNGYITIRFIVNCEGQTGRFRVKTMDHAYKHKNIDSKITDQLINIVKELDGWKPGSYEQGRYDYYQYLTFKIESGQIISIIP